MQIACPSCGGRSSCRPSRETRPRRFFRLVPRLEREREFPETARKTRAREPVDALSRSVPRPRVGSLDRARADRDHLESVCLRSRVTRTSAIETRVGRHPTRLNRRPKSNASFDASRARLSSTQDRAGHAARDDDQRAAQSAGRDSRLHQQGSLRAPPASTPRPYRRRLPGIYIYISPRTFRLRAALLGAYGTAQHAARRGQALGLQRPRTRRFTSGTTAERERETCRDVAPFSKEACSLHRRVRGAAGGGVDGGRVRGDRAVAVARRRLVQRTRATAAHAARR